MCPNPICHTAVFRTFQPESNQTHFQNPRFMPSSKADELLSGENIQTTLRGIFGDCPPKPYNELVRYVKEEASKAFLTLVTIEKAKRIEGFYKDGFTDIDLPVLGTDTDWSHIRTLNGPRKHGDWECFNQLREARRREFISQQWTFLVPSFCKNQFAYTFRAEQPLPFVLEARGSEGTFGLVCSVLI
ncbi:hypothetical protein F4823DRAFT_617656, partial [Ustulina deusta]